MILIFQGSEDRQSWERSSRFLEPFLRWLLPSASDDTIGSAVFFARKCAHLGEFFVLALLVWWTLVPRQRGCRDDRAPSRCPFPWRTAWITLGIVFLYAVSDEFHQSFVPDRFGSPIDVLIDTTGGALALPLIALYRRLRRPRTNAKPSPIPDSQVAP